MSWPIFLRDVPQLDSFPVRVSLNFAGSPSARFDPYAFAGTGDTHGFPRTIVVGCELDDIRPSGEHFVDAMRTAGADAELYTEAGASHGHLNHPGDDGALRTLELIAGWIAR